MKKYRKKPVIVEAIQFKGDNKEMCKDFCPHAYGSEAAPYLIIATLEGEMKCSVGDYIIKGVNGEFYPCKPDIFEKTYEEVENV